MLVGPRPALNALPTRGSPRGWDGPRVQETLLGAETAPSKGGPKLRVTERVGGSKTKHCWGLGGAGSVSPSKSGPESVYYYLAVQYSWSINPPRDQEPGPTRVVGRPKGSYMSVCFLPKVEVGLKSRNNGLSSPTGMGLTHGGLQ